MKIDSTQKLAIRSVVATARKPGNAQAVAFLDPLPGNVLARMEAQSGANLKDYRSTIDTSAVRHILKEHGNAQSEAKRGQAGVIDADFEQIPDILADPDTLSYEGKNRAGREIFQFIKKVGRKYIILKEIRTGRKQLAIVSMRIMKK